MSGKRILVVDDEEDILELVRFNLEREGFEVSTAETGEKALAAARAQHPDLLVLDLMWPGVDGLEVCRQLKSDAQTSRIPIVMLTARGDDTDIVKGFELGADDYVTKPFSPRVLTARVRAVLRRLEQAIPGEDETVEVHGIVIHPRRHEVRVEGEPITLTSTEFRALHVLARRPGWVFTRQQIVESVHGEDYVVTDRSVDVMMVGLRRKLGEQGARIETVRGVGYRMKG